MKRRGFQPVASTYATLLKGYGTITDWPQYTKQLENVHNIFAGFKEYMEVVQRDDPKSSELTSIPTNMYLKVLGKAGLYQKMYDVFNDVPDEGPLAADSVTFTTVFRGLYERVSMPGVDSKEKVGLTNASDARFIWKRCTKLIEKGQVAVDAHLLATLCKVLSLGRPSDQLLAFDVIRDWAGLSKPGEVAPKPVVALNAPLASAVLELCQASMKFSLTIHFVQQLMDRPVPEGEVPLLNTGHMQQALSAYANLANFGSMNESRQALHTIEYMLRAAIDHPTHAGMILPSRGCYRIAFLCCYRGKDWMSAIRAFELMTGYDAEDFRDNSSTTPKPARRSIGRTMAPDSSILYQMARIAYEVGDRANMRQCLRILDTCRVSYILRFSMRKYSHQDTQESKREEDEQREEDEEGVAELEELEFRTRSDERRLTRQKRKEYYDAAIAQAVIRLVDMTLRNTNKRTSAAKASATGQSEEKTSSSGRYIIKDEERRRWQSMKQEAESLLEVIDIPEMPLSEENNLGSQRGLSATESVVERSIARRYLQSQHSRDGRDS